VVRFVVVGAGGTPAVLKADIASWGDADWIGTKEPAGTPAVLLVPEEGVEPTRPCGHRILSPARLPVPPLRRGGNDREFGRDFQCGRARGA
jgi:hypothetical protein